MSHPPVAELLPHRPPMVLLDEVEWFEGDTARCRVTLRPDAPLVEDGKVRAVAALEYMAQCTGVCTTLRARERGLGPMRGYLVGARELRLETGAFSVGDRLVVEATLDWDGREIAIFGCALWREGERLATATLSVYRRPAEGGEGQEP